MGCPSCRGQPAKSQRRNHSRDLRPPGATRATLGDVRGNDRYLVDGGEMAAPARGNGICVGRSVAWRLSAILAVAMERRYHQGSVNSVGMQAFSRRALWESRAGQPVNRRGTGRDEDFLGRGQLYRQDDHRCSLGGSSRSPVLRLRPRKRRQTGRGKRGQPKRTAKSEMNMTDMMVYRLRNPN